MVTACAPFCACGCGRLAASLSLSQRRAVMPINTARAPAERHGIVEAVAVDAHVAHAAWKEEEEEGEEGHGEER